MKHLLTLAAVLGLSMSAGAQSSTSESEPLIHGIPERAIILSGGQNGIHRNILTVLYDTSDMHFQDSKMPRFLLIDRMGTTVFGIGGYVEGVFQYDFGGAVDNNSFVVNDIPVPSNPAQRTRLGADFTRTNIVMQLLHNTRWGVLNVFAQGAFKGDNYGFILDRAYIQLHNVMVGKNWSTFQDLASGAPTIDYQGPAGSILKKNVQIRYRNMSHEHFAWAAAVEIPEMTANYTDGLTQKISQRFPDIPAYAQYMWDQGNSHIRLSAILRQLSYRDLVEGKNKFATGWGAQLSGVWKIDSHFNFLYQTYYGKGIGDYVTDLCGFGYDLVPDNTPGKLKAPATFGFTGTLKVNLAENLFVSGSYSLSRLYDQEAMGPDAYKRGNYIVGNVFYEPFADMQVGLEYLRGIKKTAGGEHGCANRIEAMVKYSF